MPGGAYKAGHHYSANPGLDCHNEIPRSPPLSSAVVGDPPIYSTTQQGEAPRAEPLALPAMVLGAGCTYCKTTASSRCGGILLMAAAQVSAHPGLTLFLSLPLSDHIARDLSLDPRLDSVQGSLHRPERRRRAVAFVRRRPHLVADPPRQRRPGKRRASTTFVLG